MVSIIIPVYNVADYLDKCLTSVVNQTFKDIEIILINDGSTDGSDKKCKEWAKRDKRIKYISKNNEGLGPTRNLGIKTAKYDYLAFIDSDDWFDVTAIEKMYKAITKYDADMVFCDYYEWDEKSKAYKKNKAKVLYDGCASTSDDLAVMYAINPGMWFKMYKKTLLKNISFPNALYEDMSIYPKIVTYAKKVCQINECLYYYTINRKGSITNNPESYKYIQAALLCAINYYKENGLFEKYYNPLKKYAIRHISGNIRKARQNLSSGEYKEYKHSLCDFYYNHFPDKTARYKYILWGSYNLRGIVNNLIADPDNLIKHYCFSGIISAVSSKTDGIAIKHTNPFRDSMLSADIDKEFYNSSETDADYLVIDLLEERHNILKLNQSYYTQSDAFIESKNNIKGYGVINILDNEYKKLWEKACLSFVNIIKQKFSAEKVILIKNKLCEYYGEYGREYRFCEFDYTLKINSQLNWQYNFFIKNFNGIKVIEPKDDKNFFSDKSFNHGCYPHHINGCYYHAVSDMVIDILQENQGG